MGDDIIEKMEERMDRKAGPMKATVWQAAVLGALVLAGGADVLMASDHGYSINGSITKYEPGREASHCVTLRDRPPLDQYEKPGIYRTFYNSCDEHVIVKMCIDNGDETWGCGSKEITPAGSRLQSLDDIFNRRSVDAYFDFLVPHRIKPMSWLNIVVDSERLRSDRRLNRGGLGDIHYAACFYDASGDREPADVEWEHFGHAVITSDREGNYECHQAVRR